MSKAKPGPFEGDVLDFEQPTPRDEETPEIAQQEDIPRFVLSITDTQTVIGNQYYSINVGVDNVDDLNRLIPKKKRTNEARTELQNVLLHFKQAVADFDAKPYSSEIVKDTVNES